MEHFLLSFFVTVSLIAIPVYLSNGFALIFGGGKPIDFGKKMNDGKRILGNGKTIRGALAGIFFGSLGTLAVAAAFPGANAFVGGSYLQYGILLALGAMLGDIAGSFAKRRTGFEQGESIPLLDQLDFLLVGIVLGALVFVPTALEVVFLVVFTVSMHKFANLIAFKTRIKKVPW